MSKIGTIVILIVGCAAVALAQNSAAPSPEAPPTQAQPARQTVRVSNGVMLGLVEHKTMPIEVDETGKITASEPVGGDPLLIAASKDALRTFRFRPYLLNGTPTRVKTQLGFHFAVEKTADGVNGHVECMATIPNRP
jgi:protein TonB